MDIFRAALVCIDVRCRKAAILFLGRTSNMGENKGKSRASDVRDASVEDGPFDIPKQESAFSKIISSAAGLANSAVSAPSSNEVSDARGAFLGESAKSLQIGTNSNTSSWAESSNSGGQTVRSSAAEPPRFRNGHEEHHVQHMESEFSSFLDSIDPMVPLQDVASTSERAFSTNGADSFVSLQDNFLQNAMRVDSEHVDHRLIAHWTVEQQERRDGEEVLAILGNPSVWDEDVESHKELDNYDLHLTPEQVSKIRSVTGKIFPPATLHATPSADHPLNLRPNLDISPTTATTYGDESRLFLGPDDGIQETWKALMNDWDNVLTAYTDEVWGDLSPLVKEARQEIETIVDGHGVSETPKALRRLRLILSHFSK